MNRVMFSPDRSTSSQKPEATHPPTRTSPRGEFSPAARRRIVPSFGAVAGCSSFTPPFHRQARSRATHLSHNSEQELDAFHLRYHNSFPIRVNSPFRAFRAKSRDQNCTKDSLLDPAFGASGRLWGHPRACSAAQKTSDAKARSAPRKARKEHSKDRLI